MTFEGIVGSSFMGDLAIDGVSITNGSCHGKTTPTVLPSFTSSCAFGIFEPSMEGGLRKLVL